MNTIIAFLSTMGNVTGAKAGIAVLLGGDYPGKGLDAIINELVEKKSWVKIEQLFRENPSIAYTPEPATGRLPLHLAVIKHAPITFLKILVPLNTMALCVLDAAKESPLHYAITTKADLAVIQLMIQANPGCLEIADAQGLLPLHKALEYKASQEILKELTKAYPSAAGERTRSGKFALHYAAEHQSALDVINLLLEHCIGAASEAHNGRLPMHFACENKATLEVIKALHAANPLAVTAKGVDGMQPLHMAVAHRASVAVVEFVTQAYTDALLHRDRKGLHPIHYAIERNAPDALVRCIVTHRPEIAALRGKGSPGNFPLSTAIDKHYSPDIVRLILDSYPEAAAEKNMNGFLPLQSCIKHKVQDTDLLIAVLTAHPAAAAVPDDHGRITLHYAASRNMVLEFVQALLSAHIEGAKVCDKNGQIPLHLAVTRLDDVPLIQLLLTAHPGGVLDADRYNMVPLNYAVENDAGIAIFDALLRTNVKCSEHCYLPSKTVLHQAVEFRRSVEVVAALVNAYPGATRVQEGVAGRLPLHWAIERLLPLPILLCIDDANPLDAAFVADSKGWRSIHYAVHYPTPTPLVQRILRANPALAKMKGDTLHLQYYDQLRTQTPVFPAPVAADKEVYLLVHYAVANNALPETVAEILLYTMPYSPQGVFCANHFDTWCYVMAQCCDKYWQTVDIVLTHYEHNQPVIQKLADFRDQRTQRCIDIATPRCLHEVLRRMYYFSRYEMHKKLSIHVSKYSMIHSAVYHNTTFGAAIASHPTNLDSLFDTNKETTTVSTPVVLKFTNQRSKYMREVIVRTKGAVPVLNTEYVVQMMSFHNAQEDLKYAAEIELKGVQKYPFLLVFKQGDRDLGSITKHEHFAGLEETHMPLIRKYCIQLLRALHYLHETAGIVHGDLKPSNIIREDGILKVGNLGGATKFVDKEIVSAELQQLGYACPELAHLQRYAAMLDSNTAAHSSEQSADGSNGGNGEGTQHFLNKDAQLLSTKHSNAVNDAVVQIHANDLNPIPNVPGQRILSSPAQDMWSLGAIFYLLLTGEPLFLNNVSEDIDSDQIDMLTEWPDFVKQKRLEKIRNTSARCLLSQLLSRDPLQRPSAAYCLQHPFIQDVTPIGRYVGVPASYGVYVCYRRTTTKNHTAIDANPDHDSVIAEVEVAEEEPLPDKEKTKTALSRMFGTAISLSSASQEDDEELSEGGNSLDVDSQEKDTAGDNNCDNDPVAPAVVDPSTADGRYTLLQQLLLQSGAAPAPSGRCLLSTSLPSDLPTTGIDMTSSSIAAKMREIVLTKSSAAVIVLTKETWKALEDRCTCLARDNAVASKTTSSRRVAAIDTKAKGKGALVTSTGSITSKASEVSTIEQQQLLDDFLYEVRLIVELQSMGLLERGVFVVAVGDPALTVSNQTAAESGVDRTLDSYFESYMSDMVGRYGGSHPTKSMPNVPIRDVEDRLVKFISSYGYGYSSTQANLPMTDLFRYLVRFPTFHIIGPEKEAFRAATESISALVFGSGRIIANNETQTHSGSRPNTGAFNMLRNSQIGTPLVATRTLSANNHSRSFSGSFANTLPGITAGINAGILGMGNTVTSRSPSSRGNARVGSATRLSRAVTPSSPSNTALEHLRLSSDVLDQAVGSVVPYRSARSPLTGLRVRAYTPTKSPRHLGYADITAQMQPPSMQMQGDGRLLSGGRARISSAGLMRSGMGVVQQNSTGYASHNSSFGASPAAHSQQWGSRSFKLDRSGSPSAYNIPVRPWSGMQMSASANSFYSQAYPTSGTADGIGATHSRDTEGDADEALLLPDNDIAFYNNQDIVTMPYFTEIVGEDRVRTATAMNFMSTKLEESENALANMEDELALLRAQMSAKDQELSHLRSVVAASARQSVTAAKVAQKKK